MLYKYVTLLLITILLILAGWMVLRQIEEYSLTEDPMLIKLKNHLAPIFDSDFDEFTSDKSLSKLLDERRRGYDDLVFIRGGKSYTINKHKVYLCLRDEHGEYYGFNLLVYVTLHELAHCMSDSVGHDNRFDEVFETILSKAAHMNLYDPDEEIDPSYCTHND